MSKTNNPFDFRIGSGVDIHQLVKERLLKVGGVRIESEFGALGHSDADVLLHAICDALLGAANLRDIGHHFPDTDPKFKNIDSKKLLEETMKLIKSKNYAVGNIDCTVLLEYPKLNLHIPEMKSTIANLLEVEVDRVSIKATRGEKMGYIGNSEGIQAYATVLIFNS